MIHSTAPQQDLSDLSQNLWFSVFAFVVEFMWMCMWMEERVCALTVSSAQPRLE